jgi:hypothetical protein
MSDPTEYDSVIAQVAATFAGFGSLASGIGKRRGGDDARMDAYRLRSMLTASLSATLLSLLPITFGALFEDDTAGLHAAALLGSSSILIFTPASMYQARHLRHVAGFSRTATLINLRCVWGAFAALIMCLVHEPSGREAAWYLLALIGLLVSTLTLFARVIVSMLAPYHVRVERPGMVGPSVLRRSLGRTEATFPEADVAPGVLDVGRPAHQPDEAVGKEPAH